MHHWAFTVGRILKMELADLIRKFGKAGKLYYNICRGIDERPVEVVSERNQLERNSLMKRSCNKI